MKENYHTRRTRDLKERLLNSGITFIDLDSDFGGSNKPVRAKCDCSEIINTLPHNLLKRGANCKICRYKKVSVANRKHSAPEWFQQRFKSIENRCTNIKNKHYKNYGGRGIKLEFNSVDEMWSHMEKLDNCGRKLTIDRINNNGNYTEGNLRWVSHLIQNNNQRKKVVGVRRVNGSPNFQARITKYGKGVHLGTFKTYEEAARAVQEANKNKIGEYYG